MTENMRIVIDTYAWIEYFSGSTEGKKAKRYIEEDYEIIVPSIVIAELSNKYRIKGKEKIWNEVRLPFIEIISTIFPLETKIADKAGKIKAKKRKKWKDYGLADGIISATAEIVNGKILTGDEHLLEENSINISS